MVQQRTVTVMTLRSSLRCSDMPHTASFTSLPTNSSHSLCGEPPPTHSLDGLTLYSHYSCSHNVSYASLNNAKRRVLKGCKLSDT